MKVLIACERSGRVRDAFIAAGHDAISCDLAPTESPGPHVQGDVLPLLRKPWDLVIAHPECTRLTLAGVRWLHERNLWAELDAAVEFFRACLNANAPKVAVENPIPHGHAARRIGVKYSQIIHPWQFGHGETKATCLWLRGLPLLEPTEIVSGRAAVVHRMSPGPDRAAKRSATYPGIAKAMAAQWSEPARKLELAA
jgi:hypothetical protein